MTRRDFRVSGASSNTGLVPDLNVVISPSGASRTVTVTPVPNGNGVTTITLTVNDGAATTTTHFQVTVTAVNDPPSITPIADQTILEDGTTGPLSFTIGDIDNDISELSVSGASSNTGLVPDLNVATSPHS